MQALTEVQQLWMAHVEALESFNGTAAEYARLNDLEVSHLYAYKSRLRKRALEQTETRTQFVQVTSSKLVHSPGVVVALPNGVRLSLPSLDAPGLLERLAAL